MPTKSRRRNRNSVRTPKKSRRRRSVQSTIGNILPPIDVRNSKDIPGLMKRIMSGPVTIILVYADWCGHCHTFMPKFKSMIKSPNRTTQVASIESSMEKQVNEALRNHNSQVTPMSVKGYPSVNAVDMQGNFIKEIPRESVETVLNTAGPLAEQSIASPNKLSIASPNKLSIASPNKQLNAPLSIASPNKQLNAPLSIASPNIQANLHNQNTASPQESPHDALEDLTPNAAKTNQATLQLLTSPQPPKKNSLEGITFVSKIPQKMIPSTTHMGGSLYKKLIGGLRRK